MKILLSTILGLFFILKAPAQPGIKAGNWRAALDREDGKQIIFNLKAVTEQGKTVLYLTNADELMRIPDVRIQADSIFINMPVFESAFKAKIVTGDSINGVWERASVSKQIVMPFTATTKNPQRFKPVFGEPTQNVNGKWAIRFASKQDTGLVSIGNFKQTENKVTGSVLSSTGDNRYLEGIVSGDSLWLSGFDGIHALLYTAKINGTNLAGKLYSGAKATASFTATLDSNVTLQNSAAMYIKDGKDGMLDFTFKDLNGHKVSIKDERFKNKVVIIDIMGSWCPNCMDETAFLSDYYKKNKDRGIEVISLAYELTTDFQRSKNSLLKFKDRFNVTYPILITGVSVADTLKTEKTLPQLTEIKMFPTTIILDKTGKVSKIDTGFQGPATGEYYTKYVEEFTDYINKLVNG